MAAKKAAAKKAENKTQRAKKAAKAAGRSVAARAPAKTAGKGGAAKTLILAQHFTPGEYPITFGVPRRGVSGEIAEVKEYTFSPAISGYRECYVEEQDMPFLAEQTPGGSRKTFIFGKEALARVSTELFYKTTPEEFERRMKAFIDIDPARAYALMQGAEKANQIANGNRVIFNRLKERAEELAAAQEEIASKRAAGDKKAEAAADKAAAAAAARADAAEATHAAGAPAAAFAAAGAPADSGNPLAAAYGGGADSGQ